MDDLLLARRQKDVDGYVERYRKELDKRVGRYVNSLSTEWHLLENRLCKRIKALYDDVGATKDPRKLLALSNKINRLEALASQLAADIKNCEAKMQPYYTGALKYEFEKAYYTTAFGLEQGGKVAVTVPALAAGQVLGVLSNSWLPDGKNYSQRIGVNMANFAGKVKDAVKSAVMQGKGWNETALDIQAKTGEGLFNSVRLARTEINRAAALGASYTYMQNADILDGKRWNATLDSRTAPKDARNDGKIFDLDYDTPDKLGVPGQRIPNHPHCRCQWSPVLSALGVNNRERIAKDANGKRIYTKAGTYEAYAKEQGLPELSEREAHDNLKKYLRPGETVADINKKVTQWTYKGQTIIVPKAAWVDQKTIGNTNIDKGPEDDTIKNIKAVAKKYTIDNKLDRKALATDLLDATGIGHIPVTTDSKVKGVRGYCQLDSNCTAAAMKYDLYALQKNDERLPVYKLKTVFHELFHANAEGLPWDGRAEFKRWAKYDDTFAECTAHYLTKAVGVEHEIFPSYANHLIDTLPKLKTLPEFADCATITDFGEKALKYRYSKTDKKATWQDLASTCDSIKIDKYEYAKGYADFVLKNKEDIVDKYLENSPNFLAYRNDMLENLVSAWDKVKTGNRRLTGNEELFLANGLVMAFIRKGVV